MQVARREQILRSIDRAVLLDVRERALRAVDQLGQSPSAKLSQGSYGLYCLYNGPNDTHCLLGWMYDIEREGESAENIVYQYHRIPQIFLLTSLLEYLRELHDAHVTNSLTWDRELDEVKQELRKAIEHLLPLHRLSAEGA